ncbi:hypothetical protein E5676_scaffold157G00090 [Cucumis melo var. makuwa]|uniref:Ty3-gypsy retrotransposon protein n=1 Tax=Cucumis melo var. makuwa TaxID=1194695 RepID=A0A5A7V3U5_CUCMM|nr:hypothetical protein E6C27_scaffold455G00090 [Cucumis melo var. makuwa]TYK06238.1 hypothetical protein E5676_scaffold157G00090 [Cucumis melo var. makuwa]
MLTWDLSPAVVQKRLSKKKNNVPPYKEKLGIDLDSSLQAESTSAFKPSRLQPPSRADSSLQAESILAFLAKPIHLSLSRQPAPVPCTYFGPCCLESAFFLLLGLVEQISKLIWLHDDVMYMYAMVSFGITTYLRLRSPTRPPVWHGYRYDLSDSTASSQPDCLSVSSGFATEQYVLGAPPGHRRPDSVPTGAHVARVWERASFWVKAWVRAKASWRATRSDRGEP